MARGGKPAKAVERAAVFDRETDLPGPAAVAVARLYAIAATAATDKDAAKKSSTWGPAR